jgi:hypothetical protein
MKRSKKLWWFKLTDDFESRTTFCCNPSIPDVGIKVEQVGVVQLYRAISTGIWLFRNDVPRREAYIAEPYSATLTGWNNSKGDGRDGGDADEK